MMNKLSGIWRRIQGSLFPRLDDALSSPMTDDHKKVAKILEIVRAEDVIRQPHQWTGRPAHEWALIGRAFVAKAVLGLTSTRDLISRLKVDENLRRLCGWQNGQVPSESTFSRVFAQFATLNMPERIHGILIREHVGGALVENSSIDGSALEGREKAVRKKEPKKRPPKKRGRKKKGEEVVVVPADIPALDRYTRMNPGEIAKAIPKDCDWGGKKNSQGNVECWRGFKIHIHSAEGEIPLAVLVTSASVHDSQPVPYLVKRTKERCPNVLYTLTDAAYDAQSITRLIEGYGGVHVTDSNPRGGEKIPLDPAKKERYKKRSGAERLFSRLKEEFGVTFLRVRGPRKVTAHVMFAVLALTADQLLRLVA